MDTDSIGGKMSGKEGQRKVPTREGEPGVSPTVIAKPEHHQHRARSAKSYSIRVDEQILLVS